MFIETVIAAIIVVMIRGADIKNLERLEFKYWYFLILGFFLQSIPVLFDKTAAVYFPEAAQLAGYIFVVLSYLFILFPLLININIKGAYFALVGTITNAAVIFVNNGMMPVSKNAILISGYQNALQEGQRLDLMHYVADGSTRLFMFSDVIPIPRPYPFPQILSIGDILICVGIFIFINSVFLKKVQDPQAASLPQV